VLHLLLPLLCGALGVALLVGAWRRRRVARQLRATPTSRLAELRAGVVAIDARVAGDDALTSPLTGTPCAYYELHVEQLALRKGADRWRTLVDDRQGSPVRVADDGGEARLDLSRAQRLFARDAAAATGAGDAPNAQLHAALGARYPAAARQLVVGRSIRWREVVLRKGDALHAFGTARARDGWVLEAEPLLVVTDQGAAHLDAEVVASWRGTAAIGAALVAIALLVGGLVVLT